MNIVLKEALGYLSVSVCALLADFSILWILVHYYSWWYLAAATASFVSGLVVAYSLSIKLVFKFRRLKDQRVEFLSFAVIGAVGLLFNTAVMGFSVNYLGMHYLAAKCAAAGFTFAWNFAARRQLLFVRPNSI